MSVGPGRSRRSAWLTLALCAAGLTLSACADSGLADQTTGPTTWTTLTTGGGLIATNCQGCHGASGGLSLASDQYAAIVTSGAPSAEKPALKLIDPILGKASSYLYLKMNNGPGITGSVMPFSQLSASDIGEVGDWIDAGAPEK